MERFSQLIEDIYSIASQQHNNVHLLLSSVAVIYDDNQLLDMCIYVECGMEKPKLTTFCKANPSTSDFKYHEETQFFSQHNSENNRANRRTLCLALIYA
jgi:hypothetical protein